MGGRQPTLDGLWQTYHRAHCPIDKNFIHNNNNRLYYIEPITRIETLKKTISNERFTRDELYALKNNIM